MRRALFLAVFVACASQQNNIRIVKNFRELRERRDFVRARPYVAPEARVWFEGKSGPGEPFLLGGGRWDHWDQYFHSKSEFFDWRSKDNAVTVSVRETNDFMRLLDWQAPPYTMTFWLDEQKRISGVLIKSGGKAKSRFPEFKAWADKTYPRVYLVIGHQPERWRALLEEWRYGTKR
jgi:hypothetical protein